MSGVDALLGRSLSFPLRPGADGRLVWSQGSLNVRESIGVILRTDPGERVMLPPFGAGLARFLAEPNVPTTHARIADAITRSLARWETRIVVDGVDVVADPSDPTATLATITYRLVATGTRELATVQIPLGSG
jgi:phage baseplate assembly protein W